MKIITLESILTLILLNTNKPFTLLEPSVNNPPILGFIGSRDIYDFKKNINVSPQEWPPQDPHGYVHRGFISKLDMLLKENIEIDNFLNNNNNIVLTGHSLGGAICTLLASKLVSEKKTIDSIYTFGAPPMASTSFKEYYKTQGLNDVTYRYTTPKDPVTNLIPVYNHLGKKILVPYNHKSILKHHELETYNNQITKLKMGRNLFIY